MREEREHQEKGPANNRKNLEEGRKCRQGRGGRGNGRRRKNWRQKGAFLSMKKEEDQKGKQSPIGLFVPEGGGQRIQKKEMIV